MQFVTTKKIPFGITCEVIDHVLAVNSSMNSKPLIYSCRATIYLSFLKLIMGHGRELKLGMLFGAKFIVAESPR